MTEPTPFPGLARDLATVLNKHSVENDSDTPDFILAEYLVRCLVSYGATVQHRRAWFGDDGR